MGINVFEELNTEQQAFKAEILAENKKYLSHRLDMAKDVADAVFLFSIKGTPTIPQGELIAVKGRAKQGKSQFEYLLTSVMLSGLSFAGIRPDLSGYKVLLFDTEQSQASLKKCVNRALKTANMPINQNVNTFIPFYLRPLSIEERKLTIENAIKEEKPNIVFIDGIRDLLSDFNSLEQSADLISWLLRLIAENGCTIVCVLHQNKGKDDGNMRGHLGTELLNKVSDCFEVSSKDGRFVVSCTDSRNLPAPDFAFSLHDEQYQEESVSVENKSRKRTDDIQRVLGLCFKEKQELSYGELLKYYQLEGAIGERTAKDRIKEAKEHDFLICTNGLYSIRK